VIRAKFNTRYRRRYSHPADKACAVTSRTLLTLPIQYAGIGVDSSFIDSIVRWNP